ncbi:centrosomal protein of 120 kDa isoform X2 [Hyposmocoma kahamanoa]|uniref:centrosomal protein of 120 kDa isoform X2 n=1 Tax=Hyposmocoma kahamanoa TaxID=1477025 RepID=UPI000E6D5D98|nr:centrosomal protein of 120 kDa isoform X2 [Hyposmocoma kahamanoa]
MDELRGPTIQIVLHIKEGLGFGFLRTPFIVSGSLNGYMLETDPVVPCHAPVFDAELVWEADKRRFRSLRVQNVPIKVEVHTLGTQGRKDKVGYFLLSLLGAVPSPSNKIVDLKLTWHRLLGIRSEGKCCQPQLQVSLSIEDRVNTVTPRNELCLFHSNEVVYPSSQGTVQPQVRSILMTLNEYILESKRTALTTELQPRLLCDEGLIQIGNGRHLFVLSFVIGAVDNLDLLLPVKAATQKEPADCFVNYSVFTHDIRTDRVEAKTGGSSLTAQFNQRTSLRIRSSLSALALYFAECPHLVIRVCVNDMDRGICSMDLRKLIPTNDIHQFQTSFCNSAKALTIHERCFLLRCDETEPRNESRRPYVDVEMTLKYLGVAQDKKPSLLTARSVTQLESDRKHDPMPQDVIIIDCKSGSCTNLTEDIGGVSYTNMGVSNTSRYKNAGGDAYLQTNELADLIKKMYESFTSSQEKLLAARVKPTTSDMQVQVEPLIETEDVPVEDIKIPRPTSDTVHLEPSKSDTCIRQTGSGHYSMAYMGHNPKETDLVKMALTPTERDAIMQKFVDELEDWKEKQQELYKCQLQRKEEYHLELLAKEWAKKRVELECKLSKGVEQCRALAADLSRATEDFRLRGYRNTEREKKELRLASQQMEDDMKHQIKLKDMRIEELEAKVQQLQKQVDVLQNNLRNNEKEAETKYSGLTKGQTASLIQELRCLEEKLDSAVQSKAFFKEQWGRAVRELHLSKLHTRKQMLSQLQQDRQQLGEMGLDPIPDENSTSQSQIDLKRLKDDFYVDILANTPALDTHSMISAAGPQGMEMFDLEKNAPKNPMNEKLNELITQRDRLIQQDSPNEEMVKQLNHEIRSMLLNCGT